MGLGVMLTLLLLADHAHGDGWQRAVEERLPLTTAQIAAARTAKLTCKSFVPLENGYARMSKTRVKTIRKMCARDRWKLEAIACYALADEEYQCRGWLTRKQDRRLDRALARVDWEIVHETWEVTFDAATRAGLIPR